MDHPAPCRDSSSAGGLTTPGRSVLCRADLCRSRRFDWRCSIRSPRWRSYRLRWVDPNRAGWRSSSPRWALSVRGRPSPSSNRSANLSSVPWADQSPDRWSGLSQDPWSAPASGQWSGRSGRGSSRRRCPHLRRPHRRSCRSEAGPGGRSVEQGRRDRGLLKRNLPSAPVFWDRSRWVSPTTGPGLRHPATRTSAAPSPGPASPTRGSAKRSSSRGSSSRGSSSRGSPPQTSPSGRFRRRRRRTP